MTKHIMVDLKTWGTKPGAVIVSIGAAEFDPWGVGVRETFHQAINPGSCMKAGFRADPDTLTWWMNATQAEAREAWLSLPKVDLDEALIGFENWADYTLQVEPKDLVVWGNGATFDNVLLRGAFEALGFPVPWTYKGDRCFRTLKNMAPDVPATVLPGSTLHDGLADAINQAHWAQAIVRHLGLKVL